VKVGLISDTHGQLRARVLELFAGVDVILHAGDIGNSDIITELETIAPVHAVHGNTDDFEIASRYGEVVQLSFEDKTIVLTHGHKLGTPVPKLLRKSFPAADIVIYGHTHVPLVDRAALPILINPGAAGPARFKLKPSIAILELPAVEVTPIEL
jgi:hypothetical protein